MYSFDILIFDLIKKNNDVIDKINKKINKISLLKLKNENNKIILSKNKKFIPKKLAMFNSFKFLLIFNK